MNAFLAEGDAFEGLRLQLCVQKIHRRFFILGGFQNADIPGRVRLCANNRFPIRSLQIRDNGRFGFGEVFLERSDR
ncbi:hypothetical protein D3C74_303600 [compost metagenome]